jgi:hypothetical protein
LEYLPHGLIRTGDSISFENAGALIVRLGETHLDARLFVENSLRIPLITSRTLIFPDAERTVIQVMVVDRDSDSDLEDLILCGMGKLSVA